MLDAATEGASIYPTEFLNSLSPSGMPPHTLRLKINLPVVLLRNIDPDNGLCNGTRLICRNLARHVIEAEIITGRQTGKRVFIPRIPFHTAENEMNTVQFSRRQFPLRPAFAMTINKSQGRL